MEGATTFISGLVGGLLIGGAIGFTSGRKYGENEAKNRAYQEHMETYFEYSPLGDITLKKDFLAQVTKVKDDPYGIVNLFKNAIEMSQEVYNANIKSNPNDPDTARLEASRVFLKKCKLISDILF